MNQRENEAGMNLVPGAASSAASCGIVVSPSAATAVDQEGTKVIKLGVTPAARGPGRQTAGGAIRRQEPPHERHGYLEMPGRRTTGVTRLDKASHPLTQIQRVGLGHRSSPSQE